MSQFYGDTIDPKIDGPRLLTALERIRDGMADGKWRTLKAVAALGFCSEAGASARLRDLRRPKWGSHAIESRRVHGGLWEYRDNTPQWSSPSSSEANLRVVQGDLLDRA